MGTETVTVETTVWQVEPDGHEGQRRATFHYGPAVDPYLTTLTFHYDDGPVVWEFGRDLLADGVDGHAGIGDVRVWPWANNCRSGFVAVALSAPGGNALLKVPRSAVVRFLRQSAALVPYDGEEGRIDWDAVVRRIGEEARPC